jgi:membrane protein
MGEDNLSVLAAGCAFFSLLSIFPAITALVSVYGLFADPVAIEQQASILADILPPDAYGLVVGQMRAVASAGQGSLGWSLILSLGFAFWSASAGVRTLFAALNIAYNEEEKRSIFVFYATALAFTIGALLAVFVALLLIVGLPAVLALIGLERLADLTIRLVRWPLLGAMVVLGIGLLYRFGPSRRTAKWRWVTWGSCAATLLWLVASILFSLYVTNFASYNQTYGSIGAVVVALMWFYVSAFVLLLGAELNAELEHQTARDTTTGPEKPMGQRGAWVADNVAGES